jgi:hypothetical protein
MIKLSKAASFSAALLLAASFGANAGSFEIWSDVDKASGQTIAVVSFSGDGVTQDAQADFTYGDGLEFVAANTKVAGSICVGFAKDRSIRIVPPSGAGQALPSKATDYCSFSFKSKRGGVIAKGAKFSTKFQECAAPSGTSSCSVESLDLSEKSAK